MVHSVRNEGGVEVPYLILVRTMKKKNIPSVGNVIILYYSVCIDS